MSARDMVIKLCLQMNISKRTACEAIGILFDRGELTLGRNMELLNVQGGQDMSIMDIMMGAVEKEAQENRPNSEAPPAWVWQIAARALVDGRCLTGPVHDETFDELEKL